ncbi:MAG: hypothetical protein HQK52_00085 [Oligoflexia bacterium]|nr:hypothetical protein [Oligoflexia bacterium]
METLAKNSSIIKLKSKFFLYRAFIYASFLLVPTWLPKLFPLTPLLQIILILFYILFIASQWFLLGKEIDHRFKIYYKVNSSIDRISYRLVTGKTAMLLYFAVLELLPKDIIKHFYWGTWVVLGLFYSWPTRGKIIEDTISMQLIEFKFLDAFEKTVLGIILLFFLFSIPKFPMIEDIEAIKLFLDPSEKIHQIYWNFLSVNYFPFQKLPQLYKLSWCLHFYFVELGSFLLIFYTFLRLFISRRTAILGVFALISSWSFPKILGIQVGYLLSSTFSLLWIWSTLWCIHSSTYRSGLFIGVTTLWGTIVNRDLFILGLIQLAFIYIFSLRDKTFWFKRQIFKYASFGLIPALIIFISSFEWTYHFTLGRSFSILEEAVKYINQKAFFSLSIIGLGLLIIAIAKSHIPFTKQWGVEIDRMKKSIGMILILCFYQLWTQTALMETFSLLWIITFLSLLPLEWPLILIRSNRSRYNLVYMIYILICLLDSHFEGRVKIFLDIITHKN